MENWFVPYQVSELPPAQRVLILAPHPDDEVFGCGGAAALLQQDGASVEVLVLTDGAGFASDAARQSISQTRQAETNLALATLGLPAAEFWGIPDRSLASDSSLPLRIASRLQGVDLVFAPSVTEVHPDHAAVGRAILVALQTLISKDAVIPNVMFYEVGAPLPPNFLLDITAIWPVKRQAMRCFHSQQMVQDYARHIEGLNIFRTYSLGADVQYAEAYFFVRSDQVNVHLLQHNAPTLLHGRDAQSIDRILATAEAEVESLKGQLIAAHRLVAELTQSIHRPSQSLDQEMLELRATIDALKTVQQSLLDSRSWRLTRPLRWLGEKLFRQR